MKEVREVKQADRKRQTQAKGGGDRVMERDFFNESPSLLLKIVRKEKRVNEQKHEDWGQNQTNERGKQKSRSAKDADKRKKMEMMPCIQ